MASKPELLSFWKDFYVGTSRNLLDEARKVRNPSADSYA